MRVVLTYGTFDLLHYGHVNLLERAKKNGDYLIVGLSTDDFNRVKGKCHYQGYNERKAMLKSIKFIDKIIPEKEWDQKIKDIKKYKVDVIVMGDDWKGDPRFEELKSHCKVEYIKRTELISSSKIKSCILNFR